MSVIQQQFEYRTPGRGTQEITADVLSVVGAAEVKTGICNIFVHHTSASLMLCENADPTVRDDLEAFLARIAPDGTAQYAHGYEGPDDMPAHIRTILTGPSLSIPVSKGRCVLGTWQGIYLYEHRQHPHRRKVSVTVVGE